MATSPSVSVRLDEATMDRLEREAREDRSDRGADMPLPSSGFATSLSPAGQALGLGLTGVLGYGGDALADQAEEERRKRMQEAQQRQLLGQPGGSAAGSALFGGSVFNQLGGF